MCVCVYVCMCVCVCVCSNVMTAVLVAPFIFLLAAVSLNCVQRLTEWIASLAKVCAYEIT